ncbi:hypothetical protein ACIGBH_36340 [Streptomyces sp. NPDC085929]
MTTATPWTLTDIEAGRLPRRWEEYRLLRGRVGAGLGVIGG